MLVKIALNVILFWLNALLLIVLVSPSDSIVLLSTIEVLPLALPGSLQDAEQHQVIFCSCQVCASFQRIDTHAELRLLSTLLHNCEA